MRGSVPPLVFSAREERGTWGLWAGARGRGAWLQPGPVHFPALEAAGEDARGQAKSQTPPAGPQAYRCVNTPTTSRTAAAEVFSILFSSALSLSLTISSTPAAPSLTGTPM